MLKTFTLDQSEALSGASISNLIYDKSCLDSFKKRANICWLTMKPRELIELSIPCSMKILRIGDSLWFAGTNFCGSR